MIPFTSEQAIGDYIAEVNTEVCCLYSNMFGLRRVVGRVEPRIGWSFTFIPLDGANDYMSLHPSRIVLTSCKTRN